MTLDGKLPRPVVTVPQTKLPKEVHQLRSACDAVIVGGNTLRQDNPQLTSRQAEAHSYAHESDSRLARVGSPLADI